MTLYGRVADLELEIGDTETQRQSRATSSGFERHTTTVILRGEGKDGRGEDVSYEQSDHDALVAEGLPPLTGTYTFAEFSRHLGAIDLFPGTEPSSPAAAHYRRWAIESAGLDLALRQADRSLPGILGHSYDPVRFVVSTRLEGGDPGRVTALLESYPDLEFKLDPTDEWDADTVKTLAATGAVRILDLKGQYEDVGVKQDADPDFYTRLLEAFPEAIVEDPAVTDAVEDRLAAASDRLSWDAPITGVPALEALPYEPGFLNIKPSRFGSVEALFETIAYCRDNGITCYGGGQFELDVGRAHAQAIASLYYPTGPNDLAPGVYNDPGVPETAPSSPLPAFEGQPGLPR